MLHYYHKSADSGCIEAYEILSEIFEKGKYTTKDLNKALECYEQAYNKGKKSLESTVKHLRKKLNI